MRRRDAAPPFSATSTTPPRLRQRPFHHLRHHSHPAGPAFRPHRHRRRHQQQQQQLQQRQPCQHRPHLQRRRRHQHKSESNSDNVASVITTICAFSTSDLDLGASTFDINTIRANTTIAPATSPASFLIYNVCLELDTATSIRQQHSEFRLPEGR